MNAGRMSHTYQNNYLRTHRRRLALSQHEVALLLGLRDKGTIHRHENAGQEPGLQSVVAYEIIYGQPIRDLFLGQYERQRKEIRHRLLRLNEASAARPQKGYRQKALSRIAQRCAEDAE